ncbi:hypothetical protein FQN49_000436 [Arthroderma sp. PD_2]|nr:hypothetical protein FQN49_000436 [Arthroderma sp. PD_2]
MNYCGAEGLEFGEGNINIDPSVTAELPEGCRVLSTEPHGESFWATVGRINIELPNGSEMSFFIKVVSMEVGGKMVQSEFESMKAIYNVSPSFVPKPIAWGTYQSIPDTHFFLGEFRVMEDDTVPSPRIGEGEFVTRLAKLHRDSQSPNGKFGFHLPTYSGNLPQMTEWEDSWEVFFAKNLRWALKLELDVHGPDPEFDTLVPIIFDKVIPRLLRPLESEGRSVKPSLVHGDLWYANSGVDVKTGEALVFDACCFYAHNEYELGQWMPACNKFDSKYFTAYASHAEKSVPIEDYDGRLNLYKL